MSNRTYLDTIANAFSEARAWKLAALTSSALAAIMGLSLVWQAQNSRVVLVPAGFAEFQGRVAVTPKGATGSSPDYLAQVALGDLALILNWQPANVEQQFQRFLNRTTAELYAAENVRMMAEALTHRRNSASQSFYPDNVQVDLKAGNVIASGSLVRWEGEKEVLRSKTRYIVSYVNQKGFLHVSGIELSSR